MGRRKTRTPVRGARLFFGYIGIFLILIGFIILVPLILLPFYPDEISEYHLFLGPSIVAIVLGIALYLLIWRRPKARMTKLQSFLLLVTIWIISIFIASLPFMITEEFTFTTAIFEATSGLSTTAETLLDAEGLAKCSHTFLFYRVWLLFMGGIGLTLVLSSALSDANNLNIYHLEGHDDKLLPNLVRSSRVIILIYTAYIALGFGAYMACGLKPFDAICTSISALSTGGFSVVAGGIASYNSIAVEIVTEILMLLGATNFMIHFALMRGKFKALFYHSEFYCFLVMFVLFVPVFVAGYIRHYLYWQPSGASELRIGDSFRRGIFLFISAITSSGFTLADSATMYQSMDTFLFVGLLLCIMVGGQTGSTAGGVKQMRVVQAVKEIHWSIQEMIKGPNIIQPHTIVRYGKRVNVESDECKSATSFIFIYIVTMLFFAFLLSCFDPWLTFSDTLFESANLLSTTGFTMGMMVATAHPGILWTGIFAMIIGRLEPIIFIMIIAESVGTVSRKVHEKNINRRQKAI